MSNTYQMVIQYEVKDSERNIYEHEIKYILNNLSQYGADNIQWQMLDDNIYMETFTIPSEAYYNAIKKLRTAPRHLLFGKLDPCINGGVKKIQCYGLKTAYS
ncbi:hypothetical protein WAK64_15980 [Bacillus spongiae]|uniref:Uncharacterized protein n=1 Tax=Bacillus spongiae TaxID=2683610 RepID=A0ABU8HHB4_9BACI